MSPPSPLKMDRAYAMFDAVQKGLRDCIAITSSDVDSLKVAIVEGIVDGNPSSQGRIYEYEKQYKAAERYLKRLEFQLSKLEELKDQYELHSKMRDGVRSMGYAYALSPGKERESALTSIKIGFKECTETLKKIEGEYESSIGTILIEMKGIQGFARICPGDVFEITLKYGESQKWKSRGKILKDGSQLWERQQVMFKGLLDEVLSIKAVEVRGLGKKVVLGNKLCETKNLFSAHPQLMTVNLNNIGTLKLNLIVTWNPLHGMTGSDGTFSKSKLLSRSTTSLFGSIRSLPALFSGASLSSRSRAGTLPSQRPTDPFDPIITCHQQSSKNVFPSQMKKSTSAHAGVTINPNSESTSSGSTPSSLHLTGTSGFGSGSSYCGSQSVPGSALTSPDTESAPIILSNGYVHSRHRPTFKGRNMFLPFEDAQHQQPQMFRLSASVTNLRRVDSALVNKNPRPVSQIVEYNHPHERNSPSTFNQQRPLSFYHPTNMGYAPSSSHQMRGRLIDRKGYQDIIETSDENADFVNGNGQDGTRYEMKSSRRDKMGRSRTGSGTSETLAIESALQSFDFLDQDSMEQQLQAFDRSKSKSTDALDSHRHNVRHNNNNQSERIIDSLVNDDETVTSFMTGATLKSNSGSTSSGSIPSSLHLTGTSGFGSASTCCGSQSVPGSTLTSPDTESAPILLSNGHILSRHTQNFDARNKHHQSQYQQQKMFLSASVTNLRRGDPSLNQIIEYTPKQIMEYDHVCKRNPSSTFHQQKRPLSCYDPSNMGYVPTSSSHYVRGRFIDKKSCHDIIENDENTDSESSELSGSFQYLSS